jgi:hypothetical protein
MHFDELLLTLKLFKNIKHNQSKHLKCVINFFILKKFYHLSESDYQDCKNK